MHDTATLLAVITLQTSSISLAKWLPCDNGAHSEVSVDNFFSIIASFCPRMFQQWAHIDYRFRFTYMYMCIHRYIFNVHIHAHIHVYAHGY